LFVILNQIIDRFRLVLLFWYLIRSNYQLRASILGQTPKITEEMQNYLMYTMLCLIYYSTNTFCYIGSTSL